MYVYILDSRQSSSHSQRVVGLAGGKSRCLIRSRLSERANTSLTSTAKIQQHSHIHCLHMLANDCWHPVVTEQISDHAESLLFVRVYADRASASVKA